MARRSLMAVAFNLLFVAIAPVLFQAQAQTSPAELAQDVVGRWSGGTDKQFASVYPFREGRAALTVARNAKSILAGLANVIRSGDGQAVLLISGVPLLPNSGDATAIGAGFSGVYEARAESGGTWKLDSRIPLGDLGQIFAHDMNVAVRPGSGVTVEDRIRIVVKGRNGFAVRLNHTARIESVRAAGKEVVYQFGGGLFWVDLSEGPAELTIRYSIEVEKGPDTNSGNFLENAGHVRNQYFWHPFFGFNEAGDRGDFQIEVRIPKEYRVSTSIPQTERVEGGERIIEGATIRPTFALTLVYDRNWKVESQAFRDTRVEFFVSPEIQPDVTAIFDEFRSVYGLLSGRFGELPGGYRAIIQANSWQDNPGWRFASNHAVVSAMTPAGLFMADPIQRAPLGHEIAHFWTEGATGPAVNFLSEGWAVWAEGAIVEDRLGAEAANRFWKLQALQYLLGYDGKASLLDDEGNGGVSYVKGSWIFHMLEGAMGRVGFDEAMTEYVSRSLEKPAGWEFLAECMQRHAPADFDARAFLLPWLSEKRVPQLTVQIEGRAVTIHQEPSVFELPLIVEASTPQGPERQRVWVKGPETVVTFSRDVSGVKIDPDELLLLRR